MRERGGGAHEFGVGGDVTMSSSAMLARLGVFGYISSKTIGALSITRDLAHIVTCILRGVTILLFVSHV